MKRTGREIIFKWVRSHTGIEGNERADALAKEASDLDTRDLIYDHYPLSHIKRTLRSNSIIEWSKRWAHTSKGSVTKEYFPTIEERLRTDLKTNYLLTQYLTGHGKFNQYLKRFKIIDCETCDCGQNDTATHRILDCDKYLISRMNLINEYNRIYNNRMLLCNVFKHKTLELEFKNLILLIRSTNSL